MIDKESFKKGFLEGFEWGKQKGEDETVNTKNLRAEIAYKRFMDGNAPAGETEND